MLKLAVVLLVVTASAPAWSQTPSVEEVLALREQARAAYPEAFVDRLLWSTTIDEARTLTSQNSQDPELQRLMAEIYTETKWWLFAWETWRRYRQLGGNWEETAREQAAFSARSLAFYALQRGDMEEAEFWNQQAAALEE